MKTFTKLSLAAFLIFCCTTNHGFAQGVGDHITMTLDNCTQPTDTSLEFDLFITSDGQASSDLRINSASFGVNFNTAILPVGATLTTTVIGGTVDPIFPNGGLQL